MCYCIEKAAATWRSSHADLCYAGAQWLLSVLKTEQDGAGHSCEPRVQSCLQSHVPPAATAFVPCLPYMQSHDHCETTAVCQLGSDLQHTKPTFAQCMYRCTRSCQVSTQQQRTCHRMYSSAQRIAAACCWQIFSTAALTAHSLRSSLASSSCILWHDLRTQTLSHELITRGRRDLITGP